MWESGGGGVHLRPGDTSLRGLIGFDSFVSRVFVLRFQEGFFPGAEFALRIKTLFLTPAPKPSSGGGKQRQPAALNIHDCG